MLSSPSDYIDKMNRIVVDQMKFTEDKVEKYGTKTIEVQVTTALRKPKSQNLNSSGTCERLGPTDTTIPRLYVLPKVHKLGVSLTAKSEMTDSPYLTAVGWFVDILEPFRTEIAHYNLKDTI